MAKSNKPIVWGPFAGGGTVTAFLTPALVLLTLMAALGHVPALLEFNNLRAFAGHWLGKIVIFGIIFLSIWHAAHRFRVTMHDFGLRADGLVATVSYLIAAAATVMTIIYLVRI